MIMALHMVHVDLKIRSELSNQQLSIHLDYEPVFYGNNESVGECARTRLRPIAPPPVRDLSPSPLAGFTPPALKTAFFFLEIVVDSSASLV